MSLESRKERINNQKEATKKKVLNKELVKVAAVYTVAITTFVVLFFASYHVFFDMIFTDIPVHKEANYDTLYVMLCIVIFTAIGGGISSLVNKYLKARQSYIRRANREIEFYYECKKEQLDDLYI